MHTGNPSRRSFMKLVAAAPLLSQIAARDLYAQAATAVGRDPGSRPAPVGVDRRRIWNCHFRGSWRDVRRQRCVYGRQR
jgi:hypothetical protein